MLYCTQFTQLYCSGQRGGRGLRGMSYFPCFQQFPYSKRCSSNNRSEVKYQKHVNNVKNIIFYKKGFNDNLQNIS